MRVREEVTPGLRGVPACTTAVSSIEDGVLRYRGYDIRDLVATADFPAVTLLLWLGRWPGAAERERLDAQARQRLPLPAPIAALLGSLPVAAAPLALLRTALSADGALDVTAADRSESAVRDKAVTAYARTAVIAGLAAARLAGRAAPPPRPDLSREAAMLWLATGAEPAPAAISALNAALITFAEHELNPSTFAARIVAGTRADYWSALTAAVGALAGPRHAGGFAAGTGNLLQIGSPGAVAGFLDDLPEGAVVPGFGRHKVYPGDDPRVGGMQRHAAALCATGAGAEPDGELLLATATALQAGMAERGVPPTAELYAGLTLHLLGFPLEAFPAVVAAARVAGWTAHVLEQYADDVVFRPRASYAGSGPRTLPA